MRDPAASVSHPYQVLTPDVVMDALALRDWLNQQMLVAPVVLPALGTVAASGWMAQRWLICCTARAL